MICKITKIKLMKGDCLERMKDIKKGSVDMVLTDPPYGTTACKWDSIIPLAPMWGHLIRVIKPNGAIVITASQPFTTMLIHSNIKMFKYCWIWEKPQGVDPFMAKKRPLNNIEDIIVFSIEPSTYNPQKSKGKPYKVVRDKKPRKHEITDQIMRQTQTVNNGDRLPTRIVRFNQDRGLHPTQKPVALMEYLIKTYTNEKEMVLDFTMGSGTTGVACLNTDRRFIGIEIDPEYFRIAEKRINENYKPKSQYHKKGLDRKYLQSPPPSK